MSIKVVETFDSPDWEKTQLNPKLVFFPMASPQNVDDGGSVFLTCHIN